MNPDPKIAIQGAAEVQQPKPIPPSAQPPHAVPTTIQATAPAAPVDPLSASTPPSEADVPVIWNVGDVILDTYEVKKLSEARDFAEGGFGRVYRVHHKGWNLDLAVKSPLPQYFSHEQQKANFERECEAWIDLGLHPHIVSCHYVRRLGGIPRVFAEFMEGGSLSDWIGHEEDEVRRLYEGGHEEALKRMLDLAIQFAWGLHYAHEKGLIHQDVKPSNLMMTLDGMAKASDFGLAKARAVSGEDKAAPAGHSILATYGGMTEAYSSPEQAQAGAEAKAGLPPERRTKLTRQTDIWSWAVSILEMFTGAVTWQAGQIAHEALKAYREMGSSDERIPRMPDALYDVLAQCLRVSPEERPADFYEVSQRLIALYAVQTGEEYAGPEPKATELLADSLNNKALSFLDLRKPDQAEKAWDQALKVEPHHPESTYNHGLVRWRSARIPDDVLVREMEEMRSSHPNRWIDEYLLGLIHIERGDAEAAARLLEEAAASKGGGHVQADLARARSGIGQWRRLSKPLEGHTDDVNSVSLSTDGHIALSGSKDGTLKLWDVDSGQCIRTFSGHSKSVRCACLMSNNRHVLSGGQDGTLRLWDVQSGHCIRTFAEDTNPIHSVCLSKDDQYALTRGGMPPRSGVLRLWHLTTGRCAQEITLHDSFVWAASLTGDAKCIVTGGDDNRVRIWDASTGGCRLAYDGHKAWVTALVLSDDDRYILSGSDACEGSAELKLWDNATRSCLGTFVGHSGRLFGVCLSQDMRYAISGAFDNTVRLWDVTSGRCIRTFSAHEGGVTSVSITPDATYVASAGCDKTAKIWSIPKNLHAFVSPFMTCRIASTYAVSAAQDAYRKALALAKEALVHDDPLAAARHIRTARSQPGRARDAEAMDVWGHLYSRVPRARLAGAWKRTAIDTGTSSVSSVCLTRDGRFALSGHPLPDQPGRLSDSIAGWHIRMWDLRTRSCVRKLSGHTQGIICLHLSEDESYLLSGSFDGEIRLWALSSGRCMHALKQHNGAVLSVSLSRDACVAASSGADGTVRLWETATGRLIQTIQLSQCGVPSVYLSPDGSDLLATHGSTVTLWSVGATKATRVFEGHESTVFSACMTPDSKRVLSGSKDNTLRLWDLASGECVRTLVGSGGWVINLCLSRDGRYAICGRGGVDNCKSVELWDLATGECVRSMDGHTANVISVAISADSRFVLSGGEDGRVILWEMDWDLEEVEPA